MKAVVLGGTGAVGKEIIGQLLCSGKWGIVATVGRREVTVPESCPKEMWKATLEPVIINMDNMKDEGKDAFTNADTVFCALGTTRGAAGSAENFKKVDVHYVEAAAELAHQAGAQHFSLVTSAGANPKIPASDMKLFHPLLYAKSKGLAEEAVKKQGFKRVSIFRPGLLDRDSKRGVEKVMGYLVSSVKVSSVARAMILDAEKDTGDSEGKKSVAVFEMAAIKKSGDAADPQPPKPSTETLDEL